MNYYIELGKSAIQKSRLEANILSLPISFSILIQPGAGAKVPVLISNFSILNNVKVIVVKT